MEADPAIEGDSGNGFVLQCAVDLVDRQLVGDVVVGNQYLVLPPPRSPVGNVRELCSLLLERIERLASPARAEETCAAVRHEPAGEDGCWRG